MGRNDRFPPLLLATALAGVGAIAVLSIASPAAGDDFTSSPQEILRRSFARRYGCDTHQLLTLHLRSHGRDVQRQRIEVVTKVIDSRLRALARFTEPPDLRDTALLFLEQLGRPDDYFLFLPAIGRVRRVTGAQRSDSFMGTDLSYEDLERRRVEDFTDLRVREGSIDGEPVFVVSGQPRQEVNYLRAEFAVAARDGALLETRYFSAGSGDPTKVIRFPRARLRESDGASVPTLILVQNLREGTETEVSVDELLINPEIDERLFTTTWLERDRELGSD